MGVLGNLSVGVVVSDEPIAPCPSDARRVAVVLAATNTAGTLREMYVGQPLKEPKAMLKEQREKGEGGVGVGEGKKKKRKRGRGGITWHGRHNFLAMASFATQLPAT